MAKSLSFDLRSRVLAAIAGGLSCRQAAARFGVSASSAIRWRARERLTGDVSPAPQGGNRRSDRIEAEASLILELVDATPDITLAEIRRAGRARGRRERQHGVALLRSSGDHVQKDRPRLRARASRRPEPARGVVRGTA